MLKGALSFEGLVTTSALHNNIVYHSEQSIRDNNRYKQGLSFGCFKLLAKKPLSLLPLVFGEKLQLNIY